ncbi:MAG TPA: lycopene cyclase domain-containing protein [Candidatus Paceibacterota bacterium]
MEYLVAVGVLGLLWFAFFAYRSDLRAKMLWCSGYWAILLSLGFLILTILFPHLPPQSRIVPGYWDPGTIFNLARITGGWSIEDALYMFFTGGIAAVLYDFVRGQKVPTVSGSLWRRRRAATLIPAAAVLAMVLLFRVNLMWELIAFCAIGTAVVWLSRPDLITRSLIGGVCYAVLYYLLWLFFLYFSPDYLVIHHDTANVSGISVGVLPLEEILFAFTFGLMWSAIYEYAKDIRMASTSPSVVPA